MSTGCHWFPAINTFIANSVLTLTYWTLQAEAAFSKRNPLKHWMRCMFWPWYYQDGRANKPQLSPYCLATGPYTDGDTACRREGGLQARFVAAKSTHLSSLWKNQQVSLGACNTHVLWLTQPMQVCGQASTGSCSPQSWLSNPYRLTVWCSYIPQVPLCLFCLVEHQEIDIEATAKTMTVFTGNESCCVVERVNDSNFYLLLLF